MVQSALFLPSSGCHAHWVESLWGLFIGTTLALSSLLMGQHLALWVRVQLQAEGLTKHKPLASEMQPHLQVVETEGATEKGSDAAVAVGPTQVTAAHDGEAAVHAGTASLSEDVARHDTGSQRVPTLARASFLAKLDAAHKSHEQQQGEDIPQSHVAQPHIPQHPVTNSEEEPAHSQEAPSQARHLFLEQLDAVQRSEEQQEQAETVPASHIAQPYIPQHTSTSQQGLSQPTPGRPHTASDAASVVLHMQPNTDDTAHKPPTRHSQHHHHQAQQEAKLAWFDKIIHSCFCGQHPHQPHSTTCDPGGPQLWCGCTVRDTWDVAADVVVLAILLGLTGWTLGSLIAPSVQGLPTPSDSYIWLGILFGPFGCLLRWRLAVLNYSLPRPYHWLPLGTLCANLLACMLDFGMAALLAKRGAQLTAVQTSAVTALVLGVGGCLSTVSTWVAEVGHVQHHDYNQVCRKGFLENISMSAWPLQTWDLWQSGEYVLQFHS